MSRAWPMNASCNWVDWFRSVRCASYCLESNKPSLAFAVFVLCRLHTARQTRRDSPAVSRLVCLCELDNWTIAMRKVNWRHRIYGHDTIAIFSGLVFLFSLLYAYVNCDFVLILILHCVILILILYCTATYYYVLFHWRCMYVWYVLLNYTYLLTYLLIYRTI